ncbi:MULTISPECIES: RNA polymerase sigma factor [Methylosinus]|uniref:RNA polymerase sigma factor n=1 Tax=Methylosinus trichosporium (strain ATCC 35070 / NCIMB 11131 / UNIQEM 75 / OB3b) TaxID=595536 RepID=A0A2D2CXF5_METT3|nr:MULTISPECIES: RNA polymerase sigma factor [Methylosinus]ATQ67427.1 RNA polymerase sigma factor [Methylosinus trichosporium OB3b]OBS51563.1 RNA polymerase subunit sigma-24 [Methylosinus sp. 3S-1]
MPDEKPTSFRELFLRHRRGLLDYLRRRVGPEDASDLLQETFVRALRRERFDTVEDPPAFLKQIAVNLSRDLARRRESEARYFVAGEDAEDIVDPTIAPDDLHEASERARRFLAAVEALPPKCRQAFVLRRFEDLSHDEIAARLGVTRNMVEKHLRLALERLRAALD